PPTSKKTRPIVRGRFTFLERPPEGALWLVGPILPAPPSAEAFLETLNLPLAAAPEVYRVADFSLAEVHRPATALALLWLAASTRVLRSGAASAVVESDAPSSAEAATA